MPQLNPNPWFMILIFSWLIFLIVLPPKVLGHTFTNEPTHKNAEKIKPEPWTWPWS
uniref:ATP synthase complex subunit 8 n=4 Tax=Acipenseridae TaxID=7900 RepID=W8SUQ1_HUSDA|nr:ATP synthase F0 subunit 8 [Huso dauricus]YP_009179440.1 ATP synthase F0 subunit 8 [Acipenser medirostris]YP_009298510.1 ATP synthase F0 subunit 8 [Acipenser mikadoi]YP_009370165.1 ATP synthase F0 subunit 8 [Huso dauricus x Acipenser schrenckii]AHM23839.1 ATP synthase F0 subunit 8 [Huso dauricus]AJG02645.1 ATP synthase F0 subunit 8 [Acipenser medirostris]AON77847.1 ATPase subunit 8 [Acipenser mikadoi]ARO35235.1 ATP synthase F0 subunit 8 [Huso dauricus x Acipenser schrenckii]QUG09776.1 ATP